MKEDRRKRRSVNQGQAGGRRGYGDTSTGGPP